VNVDGHRRRAGAGDQRAQRHGLAAPVKPVTLLGVAALGEPDLLVEVEAIAVLP
jgi:enamine deaminase RidA (YjgF/YER057c/UK114 family)